MLLLVFLGSAALWAQDPEPEVEASDDDAQVEAEASPPADEVTDEEIEELLGLDEDYSEIEEVTR
jgi:hypothetical protein